MGKPTYWMGWDGIGCNGMGVGRGEVTLEWGGIGLDVT